MLFERSFTDQKLYQQHQSTGPFAMWGLCPYSEPVFHVVVRARWWKHRHHIIFCHPIKSGSLRFFVQRRKRVQNLLGFQLALAVAHATYMEDSVGSFKGRGV